MTPLVGRLDGEDLIATQVRLEEEMTQRGVSRFQRNVEAARRMGAEDGTEYGSIIVSGRMKALAEAIKAWMDESEAGVSSRWGSAYKLLRGYDADVLAYLTLKHTLAGISQPRTLQHVSVSIAQSVEDEMRLSGIRDKERKKYDQLVDHLEQHAGPDRSDREQVPGGRAPGSEAVIRCHCGVHAGRHHRCRSEPPRAEHG